MPNHRISLDTSALCRAAEPAGQEQAADLQWQTAEQGLVLTAALAETLAARDRILSELERDDHAWNEQRATDAERRLEPLIDRLMTLASTIADRRSQSWSDVHTKAVAIREMSEENSDDIVHRLAAGLADDLLTLLGRQPG